ncbi:MAG: hypothetical protein AB7O52_08170 [Planctomycetota bacterium]
MEPALPVRLLPVMNDGGGNLCGLAGERSMRRFQRSVVEISGCVPRQGS